MNTYDILIVGCGYSSIGYALSHPGSVICEEHQVCDTGFYLPLRSFRYAHFSPKTEHGEKLLDIFNSLSLFSKDQQNTNGFECAICKFIAQKDIDVLLKCRVINVSLQNDGTYDACIQTNEGLSHLFAKNILYTTPARPNRYTVLFVSEDIEKDGKILLDAFDDASIEPAFYSGRYALHVCASDADENHIKQKIYEKWKTLETQAKILYMAPVFYSQKGADGLCDCNFDNPIEAFEAGYFYKEGAKQ